MGDLIDDFTDFLVFMVLFAAFSAIGIGLVFPEYYDSASLTSQSITDKSAPPALGYVEETAYRGEFTFPEVVLTTIVQDASLPAPKKYSLGSTVVEITDEYRSDLEVIWRTIANQMGTTPAAAQQLYYLHYDHALDRYVFSTIAP